MTKEVEKTIKAIVKDSKKNPELKLEKTDDTKIVKKLKGIVVSDKMNKTIVVKIDRRLIHPKYHKSYIVSKKYKVHDENNKYKVGDEVTFINSRSFSKDKKWRVLN